MFQFIAQHWEILSAALLYLITGVVATMPEKDAGFREFKTWYGWFYDLSHVLVNSRGQKAIPTKEGLPVKAITSIVLFVALMLLPLGAKAQTQTANPQIENLYGAGVSYSVNATPAVAGSALYAHLIADPGTYAFTAVYALPNTLKPFTITTNIGAGIAQKVVTFGKVPIYMPTAAGISFSGTNTGWQWNGGVLAAIHIKNQYYIMPTVRFLKSSVSNGTGYQPIVGVLFGWGQ